MFRMIEAAAACVRHLASKRPKMSQVLQTCTWTKCFKIHAFFCTLGKLCISWFGLSRSLVQVVRALDSMDEMADLNNGVKPGQSGIFTSREHSAQIKMYQRMAFGSQDYSSDTYTNSQTSSKSWWTYMDPYLIDLLQFHRILNLFWFLISQFLDVTFIVTC